MFTGSHIYCLTVLLLGNHIEIQTQLKFFSRSIVKTSLFYFLVKFTICLEPTDIDLLDPSYNPCQCDLTASICDINCCCDTSCTAGDKALFKPACRTSIRNKISNDIDEWFCHDIYGILKLQKPNWFPIMCVNVSIYAF